MLRKIYHKGEVIALLFENAPSEFQQANFYLRTVHASSQSQERKHIMTRPKHCGVPITFTNLVYTNASHNCKLEDVEFWNLWATHLWKSNQNELKELRGTNEVPHFNSIYAQLYSIESRLKLHRDEYVKWGISVSLGASVKFSIADTEVLLESGSALIADFSKHFHGFDKLIPGTVPRWWDEMEVLTFGRARCSIQVRHVDKFNLPPPLAMTEFQRFSEKIN